MLSGLYGGHLSILRAQKLVDAQMIRLLSDVLKKLKKQAGPVDI